EGCDKAQERFSAAKTKLVESCAKARMGSSIATCAQKALDDCVLSGSPSYSAGDGTSTYAPNLEDSGDKFSQCPSLAKEDLDFWRDAVKNSQDRQKSLKDQQKEVTETL